MKTSIGSLELDTQCPTHENKHYKKTERQTLNTVKFQTGDTLRDKEGRVGKRDTSQGTDEGQTKGH